MKIFKKMLAAGVSALTIAALVTPVGAQTTTPTVDVSALALPQGATSQPFEATLEPSLRTATGPVTVMVRLADAPLSLAVGRDARRLGSALSDAQQQGYVTDLNNKQNALSGQIAALGGRELGRMSRALNGVMV
ncbi:MAG: hypothetical protein MUD01_28280, partial [Chloroflexaceae bacterium]|nr:hypothetical protein [Chloroflexaceae bacterium]